MQTVTTNKRVYEVNEKITLEEANILLENFESVLVIHKETNHEIILDPCVCFNFSEKNYLIDVYVDIEIAKEIYDYFKITEVD